MYVRAYFPRFLLSCCFFIYFILFIFIKETSKNTDNTEEPQRQIIRVISEELKQNKK